MMICLCFCRASTQVAADAAQDNIFGGKEQGKINKKKRDVSESGDSSFKGSDDDQCRICLSGCRDDLPYLWRVLPRCKHGFHAVCIYKWLKTNAACPICRQSVYVT